RVMPSATAPDETSTISIPRLRRATICSTQPAIPAKFKPRPSLVSNALPIFTTQRRLCCISGLTLIVHRYSNGCVSGYVLDFHIKVVVIVVSSIARCLTGRLARLGKRLDALARLGLHRLLNSLLTLQQLGVFLLRLPAAFQVGHDVGAEALRTLRTDRGDAIDRTAPIQTLYDIGTKRFALGLGHQIRLVQYQPALTPGQSGTETL